MYLIRRPSSQLLAELIIGLKSHQFKPYSLITVLFIIMIISLLPFDICEEVLFVSISELLILGFCIIISQAKILSTILRVIVSRIITYWLLYTIINQWFEESTVTLLLFVIGFPIFVCWFIYEPVLIAHSPHMKMGTRFDYFLSRYPFFIGFGIAPTFAFLLAWFFPGSKLIMAVWYFLLINMLLFRNNRECPYYAMFIPYTKKTFRTDPVDIVEDYINDI